MHVTVQVFVKPTLYLGRFDVHWQRHWKLRTAENFFEWYGVSGETSFHVEINLLKTKRRPLYLNTQSVPRCKHFSSRL
jgi:hypothetical protein